MAILFPSRTSSMTIKVNEISFNDKKADKGNRQQYHEYLKWLDGVQSNLSYKEYFWINKIRPSSEVVSPIRIELKWINWMKSTPPHL